MIVHLAKKKTNNKRSRQDNILKFKKMRWEEKKKIEQNKIDEINNLAAALKEFKKND